MIKSSWSAALAAIGILLHALTASAQDSAADGDAYEPFFTIEETQPAAGGDEDATAASTQEDSVPDTPAEEPVASEPPSPPATATTDEAPPALDTIAVEPLAPAAGDPETEVVEDQAGPTALDAIVVTAERRVERLQDVPVAITVVNQKQMEAANVTQVTDLSRLAPALEVNGQPGNADTRISIRGISTESFSVTAEQAVSLVVDGVVMGKAPTVSLFDVGRVEILRGPQGTLFGKNASAGVVSISTNPPDPSRFMAGFRSDFGSEWDYRLLQGSVNVPLWDSAAIRINAGQTNTDGFYRNVVRDEDSEQRIEGGRVRFLWDILPTLTLNLIADYEQQYTSEQIYLLYSQHDDADTGEPLPIPRCEGTYASKDNTTSCNNDPTFNDGKAWGYSAQVEWLVGDYTINSITALRRYQQYNEIDVDGLDGNYYNNANSFNNRVLTQELRIASPYDDRLRYVAGIFFSDSHVPNFLDQIIGPDLLASVLTGAVGGNLDDIGSMLGLSGLDPSTLLSLCSTLGLCLGETASLYQPNQYTADIVSKAVFAQFTFSVTEALKLIAGARYTRDDVRMVSSSYIGIDSGLFGDPIIIPQAQDLVGRDEVSALSWRAGLQYHWNDDVMTYFTASHGYKGPQIVFVPPNLIPGVDVGGGSVTLPTPARIDYVKPEYPDDYQLGVKATLLGGLFAANAALFHTRIKDFQASVFNGQASFTPTNVPSVVTKGVELDLLGFLSENLMFNAGLLYNSATYPDGYKASCTQVSDKCPDTDPETVQDIGGRQLVVAPEWKVTFSPEYSFDLPFRARGFVSADAVYRSAMHFSAAPDTRTEVDGRTTVGMRIGVRGAEDNWEVSVFGRNLTGEYNPAFLFAPYLLSSATTPDTTTTGQALYTESFRFYGLSLGIRF